MEQETVAAAPGSVSASRVIIYSTPYCVFCKMAKEFFKKHGVAYEEKDVAGDHTAQQEMIVKSGQMGVPVIRIGEKIIIGFDQPRLKEALNIQ